MSSGPVCCNNPPKLSSTCGEGYVEEFGGLNTYITGNQDSDRAIILAADVYGYEAPKLRKLADKVAASGYLVLVPDFYNGDPATPEKPGFDVQAWLKIHTPADGCEASKAVVAALKSRGVSKIGAAGFCWGGPLVASLAKHEHIINAAVLLHPTPVTVEHMNEVKVPIAILGAEHDEYCSPEHVKTLEDTLSERAEVDYFVKVFPGVEHGWTTRYNEDNEFDVKRAEESHEDILNWFNKHIK